jgi:hypothetical protein
VPIIAVIVAAALIRGDRVMRLAAIGAAFNAVPWALSQALAACTDDREVATGLLRLGQGPVALVGPHLMILLLGVSGQLERFRWIARIAFGVGIAFMIAAWATPWTVPGVQLLSSGMFYTAVGPLTGVHASLLVIWLAIGFAIARRATPRSERRGMMRLVLGVLVCGAVGSLDTLLMYGIWGSYPIAFLPASAAASIAFYLVVWTDLVRPQGFDRGVGIELAAFTVAIVAIAVLALLFGTTSPIVLAVTAAVAWTATTAGAWTLSRARPVPVVASDRALDQFVARALQGDEKKLADRLGALWSKSLGVAVRAVWWRDGGELVETAGKQRWPLDGALADWLADHADALAITDLATMRLGVMRGPLEALGSTHGATLIVPLVDRAQLVGLVEADCDRALREQERGLVVESARAAARGLTFFALARAASRERTVAREVEIADALRLQASASRDAELGRWAVAAEYRSAARTTGAGWSAFELTDGRLALLVTEAQAHGVAAALATAALTGAFAAATASAVTLDELSAALRATADGVMRGGEPVAAFFALLDADAQTIDWACAGHPGALLVGPIAAVEPGLPIGSAVRARPNVTSLGGAPDARATSPLPPDTLVVIGSRALRGGDDPQWQTAVRDAAPLGGRLPTTLVEVAQRRGEPGTDLLAVVVRAR